MTTRGTQEPVSVGIDVSKKFLDIDCYPHPQPWRVPNSPEGHQQLVEKLRALAAQKIVLEGTGGYEFDVFLALTIAKLPVFRVNPRQVRELRQLIHASPEWQQREAILITVPGVGDKTAYVLIAELPELGSLSRRKIAALVGVASFSNDSGLFKGQRTIRGGRGSVRRMLYMATLVASRHNPVIKAHYQTLLAEGKKKNVALIACLRKLLTILNAMIRKQQTWKTATEAA